VFFKKCLGSPCYLMVVSGGSLSLGGLNKDTRRCFLLCLQVSSSSSLLFNIELWSAVRITSFSVRHRSHDRPPLENGWPLALIDQFTKWGIFWEIKNMILLILDLLSYLSPINMTDRISVKTTNNEVKNVEL
jgi:hypothetical protein